MRKRVTRKTTRGARRGRNDGVFLTLKSILIQTDARKAGKSNLVELQDKRLSFALMTIMAFRDLLIAMLDLMVHMQNLAGCHNPMLGGMVKLIYIGN
jgi:hypothetical protein